MRFLFHVGPHKTGTSYIQAGLRLYAAALGKAGVHVARQWEDGPLNPSHTGLVSRLNSERLHELKAVFSAWRALGDGLVVVSCEELATIAREPVKVLMLRELTQGCDVSIVYYARRWTELLASEWQEYVKQGSTLPLTEVLVHNLRDPAVSRIINIDATLAVYARYFGASAIRVVSYDSVVDSGDDLFAHFTRTFLGGAGLAPQPIPAVNTRLTASRTEMMRLFNILQQESGIASHHLLRFLDLQHAPAPLTALLEHLARYPRTIDVDDDDPAVRAVLRENAAQYRARTVAPAPDGRLYAPGAAALAFIGTDYALAPGFAEALRKLWRDLLVLAAGS